VRNSCVEGREIKCFNANAGAEGPRLCKTAVHSPTTARPFLLQDTVLFVNSLSFWD